MLTHTEIRRAVYQEVNDILVESGNEKPTLAGPEQLHELGINSLTLARLIIQLEVVLGVDPFAEEIMLADVRSVDDLVTGYERALRNAVGNRM